MPITLADQTAVVFIDTLGDLPVLVWTNIEAKGYVPGAVWTFSVPPDDPGMWLWSGPRFNRQTASVGWRRPTVRELVQLAELDVVVEHGWGVVPDLADDEPGLLARSVLPCTVTDDNDQPLYTLTVDAYGKTEPDGFPVHLSLTKDGPGNHSASVIYRPGFADELGVAPPPQVEPCEPNAPVHCERCRWEGVESQAYVEGAGCICPECKGFWSITEGRWHVANTPDPKVTITVGSGVNVPTSWVPDDEDDEPHPMDPAS